MYLISHHEAQYPDASGFVRVEYPTGMRERNSALAGFKTLATERATRMSAEY